MKQPATGRGAAILLVLIFFLVAPCFGHGDEKHEKGKMSAHMQAMWELKEQIPEEFRIMERTPITPDERSLERGGELFLQRCAAFHGEEGRGDGPAAKALSTPPADFLDLEHSAIYELGEKYWIIGHGTGETGMPGFPQIEPKDRWHLVNFILDLQEKIPPQTRDGQHAH